MFWAGIEGDDFREVAVEVREVLWISELERAGWYKVGKTDFDNFPVYGTRCFSKEPVIDIEIISI